MINNNNMKERVYRALGHCWSVTRKIRAQLSVALRRVIRMMERKIRSEDVSGYTLSLARYKHVYMLFLRDFMCHLQLHVAHEWIALVIHTNAHINAREWSWQMWRNWLISLELCANLLFVKCSNLNAFPVHFAPHCTWYGGFLMCSISCQINI